jgi:DNA-binding CsgD family transcriptional regulator
LGHRTTILDLATPGVTELLADFDALLVLERLGHHRGEQSVGDIAAEGDLPPKVAQGAVDRLSSLGLVEARRSGRARAVRYQAVPGAVVVAFDPSDPQTPFRLASARMALLAHLRRLGTARPARASQKGASWKRESVAVLPLEGKSLELMRSCIDRVDACLENAAELTAKAPGAAADRRPRYRVQVSVEPVEFRAPALPVMLLMERREAERRPSRPLPAASLSRRERQVADALAAGRTKREAAAALGISFATVNTLAVRAYRKLGVRRRAQLADALHGVR